MLVELVEFDFNNGTLFVARGRMQLDEIFSVRVGAEITRRVRNFAQFLIAGLIVGREAHPLVEKGDFVDGSHG